MTALLDLLAELGAHLERSTWAHQRLACCSFGTVTGRPWSVIILDTPTPIVVDR